MIYRPNGMFLDKKPEDMNWFYSNQGCNHPLLWQCFLKTRGLEWRHSSKKKSKVKRCTQIVTDPSKYVLVLRYHQDFVLIFLRQIASLVKFSTKSILIPCKLCEHNCYFNVVRNNSLLRFNNIVRATTANVLLFRK